MPLSLWMRFVVYGCFGWCFEIIFTSVKGFFRSKGKDWSFFGKSYLWMLPIYGLAAFLFEPAHDAMRQLPWPIRGVIYAIGLFIVEFITGWLLRVTTGKCPWDYSHAKYNFKGLIRWDYAPVWFGFCLVLEQLHDLLLRIRIQ